MYKVLYQPNAAAALEMPRRGLSSARGIRAWIVSRVAAARKRAAIRRARRQLMEMPLTVLKDIGVSRCEIDFLVESGRVAVRTQL